jgi:hypothetical protein
VGLDTHWQDFAVSDLSKEALDLRATVPGRELYRGLQLTGVDPSKASRSVDAQFWSFEPPSKNANFSKDLGVPPSVSDFDMEISGRVKPGTPFVVKRSDPVESNPGGAWEVVVPKYGVETTEVILVP